MFDIESMGTYDMLYMVYELSLSIKDYDAMSDAFAEEYFPEDGGF